MERRRCGTFWSRASLFRFGKDIHRLVDLHHLVEKLAPAARILDDATAGATLPRWKLALLRRQSAAKDILGELIASGLDEGVGDDHPVHARTITPTFSALPGRAALPVRLHIPHNAILDSFLELRFFTHPLIPRQSTDAD